VQDGSRLTFKLTRYPAFRVLAESHSGMVGADVNLGSFDMGQIVNSLHAQPGVRGTTEGFREAHGHLWGDAGLFVHEVIQSLPCYAEHFSGFGYSETERFQAFLPDNASGMRGILHGHLLYSL